MNTKPQIASRVALLLFGLLAVFTFAAGQQHPPVDARARRGTVQSELDYLRAAKRSISVELAQVTIRQAYDGIAKKGEFGVRYEGAVDADAKHDVSFKNVAVKDILDELGATWKLSYRVDAPDKLTVVGTPPK